MSFEEARDGLVFVSVGYVAVFLMFALLYAHAASRAAQLDLSPYERAVTRFSLAAQWVHIAVGSAVAFAAALLPLQWGPMAGFLYFLIGPLMFTVGSLLLPSSKRASK
jgi:hypothetical protein